MDDDDKDASDEALVRATLAGQPEAFGRLYDRYAPLVRAVCFDSTGGDLAQAQDLCQEAFLRAYRKLAGLKRSEQFAAWLIGIARHVCREWRRSAGRRRQNLARLSELSYADGQSSADVANDEAGEDVVDDLRRLHAAIASLPRREREALHLFYLKEQSAADVAGALGLSRSGFYRSLDRAKKRLRSLLGLGRTRGVAP